MANAYPVDGYTVTSALTLGRVGYLYLDIRPDHAFEDFKALPAALSYQGRLYGRAAFDSDRGVAVYRTDVEVACAARTTRCRCASYGNLCPDCA